MAKKSDTDILKLDLPEISEAQLESLIDLLAEILAKEYLKEVEGGDD